MSGFRSPLIIEMYLFIVSGFCFKMLTCNCIRGFFSPSVYQSVCLLLRMSQKVEKHISLKLSVYVSVLELVLGVDERPQQYCDPSSNVTSVDFDLR